MKKIKEFFERFKAEAEPVFVTAVVLLVVVGIFLTLFTGCNRVKEKVDSEKGGEKIHYVVYK